MTVQFKATVRSAMLDAIETTGGASCSLRVYTGAQPADVTQANSGTLLAHIVLPADWLAAASGGTKGIAGTWQDASADGGAGSTPGHFRIYNSQVTMDGTTCIIQGSAGIGSGDMSFNGTITAGQEVNISAFTLTGGNP
jgi:hypothetical protein